MNLKWNNYRVLLEQESSVLNNYYYYYYFPFSHLCGQSLGTNNIIEPLSLRKQLLNITVNPSYDCGTIKLVKGEVRSEEITTNIGHLIKTGIYY